MEILKHTLLATLITLATSANAQEQNVEVWKMSKGPGGEILIYNTQDGQSFTIRQTEKGDLVYQPILYKNGPRYFFFPSEYTNFSTKSDEPKP